MITGQVITVGAETIIHFLKNDYVGKCSEPLPDEFIVRCDDIHPDLR